MKNNLAAIALAAALAATLVLAAPVTTEGLFDLTNELETMAPQARSGDALAQQPVAEVEAAVNSMPRLNEAGTSRPIGRGRPPRPRSTPARLGVPRFRTSAVDKLSDAQKVQVLQQLNPKLLPRLQSGKISRDEWIRLHSKWHRNNLEGKYLPPPHNLYPDLVVVEPANFKAFVQRETGLERAENAPQ